MRIGLNTDGLAHLTRQDVLSWCAERDIRDIEMCVGPWSPRAHLDLAALLSDPRERHRLTHELDQHGIALASVNGVGNPMHPQPGRRAEAVAAIRGAVKLAALLEVDRVVVMSGCPGSRGGGGDTGIFGIWSMALDDEGLWEWQFTNEVAPFWREMSSWTARVAPNVRLCFELHPGATVFNPATFQRLAEAVGDNIGINLDPSHFWWQGMDPVTVVEHVGSAIGFAHGKDTTIYHDRVGLQGVLDHRFPIDPAVNAWHFSAVGDGHSVEAWARLLMAMRAAGFDGVIAIEQEDPTQPPDVSIERSLSTLREALSRA